MLHLLCCWKVGKEQALLHISFLGNRELPCRESPGLQHPAHITAEVWVESRGTPDSPGKKNARWWVFLGLCSHLWSSGQMDLV